MSERANRISVQGLEDGTYEAKLFRTHKQIKVVNSVETGWAANPQHNKTMQRELFRAWVCDNAEVLGIDWDPEDKRADQNRRIAKYTSDEVLMEDAISFIRPDVDEFVLGSKIDKLILKDVSAEDIEPLSKSSKGADLSRLGITDGKYGNGNWAWATVKVVATVGLEGDDDGINETYVTFDVQLVSGQLKKPVGIDDGGYTQTQFRNLVARDLGIDLNPKVEQDGIDILPEGISEEADDKIGVEIDKIMDKKVRSKKSQKKENEEA